MNSSYRSQRSVQQEDDMKSVSSTETSSTTESEQIRNPSSLTRKEERKLRRAKIDMLMMDHYPNYQGYPQGYNPESLIEEF